MVSLQVAGVRIEQNDGGDVQVDARTRTFGHPVVARPVVQRRRIGGTPPHRIGFGIVSTGHPAAAAADLPGIVAPGIAPVAGRAVVAANGEKLPDLLAGLGIDAEDRAAIGPFATLRTDDDLVLD